LCRQQILTLFPESAQAKIVSNPVYFASLQRMAMEQDSLYEATYEAYRHNRFTAVRANKDYAETTYPLSPLMPRFLFLNAVATAKTSGQAAFTEALRDMVERYPENELSAMAKDMLAMMGQGMEAKKGGTVSSLTDQRQVTVQQEEPDTTTRTFSVARDEKSLVYVVIPQNEDSLNNLLYQVALYNFTQFLIKDFDLRKVPVFTLTLSALEIAGFENMDEADWYISLITKEPDLQLLFHLLDAQIVPITLSNLELLNHPYTLEEYIQFSTAKPVKPSKPAKPAKPAKP